MNLVWGGVTRRPRPARRRLKAVRGGGTTIPTCRPDVWQVRRGGGGDLLAVNEPEPPIWLGALEGLEVNEFAGLGREALMTPGEVADRFHVDPKTVTRWANLGFIPCIRTPGGHRRYPRAKVEEMLGAQTGANAAGVGDDEQAPGGDL